MSEDQYKCYCSICLSYISLINSWGEELTCFHFRSYQETSKIWKSSCILHKNLNKFLIIINVLFIYYLNKISKNMPVVCWTALQEEHCRRRRGVWKDWPSLKVLFNLGHIIAVMQLYCMEKLWRLSLICRVYLNFVKVALLNFEGYYEYINSDYMSSYAV